MSHVISSELKFWARVLGTAVLLLGIVIGVLL